MRIPSSLTQPTLGGAAEHGYCRASLAKRYNEETREVGKKVTVRKVKRVPIFLGC